MCLGVYVCKYTQISEHTQVCALALVWVVVFPYVCLYKYVGECEHVPSYMRVSVDACGKVSLYARSIALWA